jgi:hypothetical protein
MTLSARNNAFKLEIALSFLCLLLCVFASTQVIPAYALMENETIRRSGGLLQAFTGKFFGTQLLAAHGCIAALVLFSFFSIILIYHFFEKTQSPEILYVAFFAASLSLETLRLVLPLSWVYEIPLVYQLTAARIILFGRYFGLFSLFMAGVFATGYKAQKQRNVIMVIAVTTLIIILGIPIDTQTWDSSLNMISGQISMFRLIEAGTLLITAMSFFIAAWSRSSREFTFIGMGSVLAFCGRNILLSSDIWMGVPIGLALLITGAWLICTRLHKIYLWL